MEPLKIPSLAEGACNSLIAGEHICRIAFKGDAHPFIAPFLYVFDGRELHFLATRYGKKIDYFHRDPLVTVEIERTSRDLSDFSFVTLSGRLVEVDNPEDRKNIRTIFVELIRGRKLSKNILLALGHDPAEPLDMLIQEDRSLVWKLVEVIEIRGLASN